MNRWNRKLESMAENPRVDAFLAEIEAVYRKHGLSLGHEDGHGSFIVEPLDQFNVEWLHEASDDTEKEPHAAPEKVPRESDMHWPSLEQVTPVEPAGPITFVDAQPPKPHRLGRGFCAVTMPDGFETSAEAETNLAAARIVLQRLRHEYGREFRLTWDEHGIVIRTTDPPPARNAEPGVPHRALRGISREELQALMNACDDHITQAGEGANVEGLIFEWLAQYGVIVDESGLSHRS